MYNAAWKQLISVLKEFRDIRLQLPDAKDTHDSVVRLREEAMSYEVQIPPSADSTPHADDAYSAEAPFACIAQAEHTELCAV